MKKYLLCCLLHSCECGFAVIEVLTIRCRTLHVDVVEQVSVCAVKVQMIKIEMV